MTEEKLLSTIKRYVKKQGTQLEAAKTLGISPQYLSDILSGRRPVTDSVLDALGLERYSGVRRKKVAA